MKCHDFQELLQRRLDGEQLDKDWAVREHAAACLDCRSLQQAADSMLDQLRSQSPTMPPLDLTRRILVRVEADQKNRLPRRFRAPARLGRLGRLGTYLALAASVLLAVLAGMYGLPWLRAPAPKQEPQQLVKTEPPPSMEKSVEEARQAVASLADKSTDQMRVLLSVTNPMENVGMAESAPPLEPAASLRQAGQGAAEGLQTVASSTQRAFAYFFREFTQADAGKQKDSRVH
ncbi:MAG: zf-HC2 domain-containing protein [Planctomycetes bacterium]|nr:zf-HC2 domain-containing protein [Planctomycetota bacterium]